MYKNVTDNDIKQNFFLWESFVKCVRKCKCFEISSVVHVLHCMIILACVYVVHDDDVDDDFNS